MVQTAVILAAGMGSRLKELAAGKPKGFIEIGGDTLINRSISILKKHGIKRIVIVTGFASAWYESLAEQDPAVETVHSEVYTHSGSLYSLSLIEEMVDTDFLLLESDIIYAEEAIQALQNTILPNAVLMSQFTHSGDEVYISTVEDRLIKMSKDKSELDSVTGELVGISKISTALFKRMIDFSEKAFEQALTWHYEDCLNGMAKTTNVYCLKMGNLIWGEIDTKEHLERIKAQVWPAISAAESKTP